MKKVLFVLFITLLLISCAGEKDFAEVTKAENETTSITEIDPLRPNIDEVNFGGNDFRVLYPFQANFTYQHADEEIGESVNDMLYARDRTIEEQLNIKIKYTVVATLNDVYPRVNQDVMAGDYTFELVLNHCNMNLVAYIENKLVLDWYDIPNIDLEKAYWNQNMNKSLAVQGTLPIAVSDYVIANPVLIFFNMSILNSNNLKSPYELVASGKWTWDELISMTSGVTYDLNGDGKMDAEDAYGIVIDVSGSSYMLRNLPSSCGQFIYSRDNSGNLFCSVNTEKMQLFLEKIVTLFKDGGGYLLKYGDARVIEKQAGFFGNGTYLFYLVDSLLAEQYRSIDFEYGILPMPKYDERQEDYYALNWSGLMLIPRTVKDTSYIGTVVEWLSYYGHTMVQPELFKTLMDEKIARDDKSAEMLKLIFNSLVYDPGINFISSKFYSFFDSMVIGKNINLSSYYASNEAGEITYIEKINNIFLDFKNSK